MKKLYPLLSVLFLLYWSCEEEPEDCAGEPGGDAICGCTHDNAVNYDSTATHDDGSCVYDTTQPTLQFLSPTPGDTVSGNISFQVNVQDDYEVRVQFGLNIWEYDGPTLFETESLFVDVEAPYEYEWNSSEYGFVGATIHAKAFDSQNESEHNYIEFVIDNTPNPVNVTSVEYVWNEGPEYIVQWEESADTNFQEYNLYWVNNWNGHGERSHINTFSDRTITSHTQIINNNMSPTDRNWFWIEVNNNLGHSNSEGEGAYNEAIENPTITLHSPIVEGDSVYLTWSKSTALGNEHYQLFESTSANISSGFTRYWYVGVGNTDTSITVPMLEEQYGGSETMFYQVHVFAPFGQEAVSNIMPIYLDPCGEGEVNIWGWCRNIEETTSIHHNEPGWSWLTPHPRGPIPAAIGELVNLTELIVEHSPLSGPIPPEIGNLTNLTHLELWNTSLTGSLPPEIGNLVHLETLMLSGNNFSGEIPPEIGNLSVLTELNLDFYDGAITSLPSEIGNLTNLEILNLNGHQLSTIPPEIGNLTTLTELHLGSNKLTSIPNEILGLYNLNTLSIGGNQITEPIPSEIGNLTNLTKLVLRDNQFTGEIPSSIGNLTNLNELSLENNQLTGEIPSEITNLTNLEGLSLAENQLTGEIPPEIGNLTNLGGLDLSWNQLTGEIPTSIGDLTNLVKLFLNRNIFTGVDESICNLTLDFTQHWYFKIDNNNLCPPYPSCIEENIGYQNTENCD